MIKFKDVDALDMDGKKLSHLTLLTVGDKGVGKTSLVKCFVGKKDSPFEYQAYVKKIILDDHSYKIHLRSGKGVRSFLKRSVFLSVRGIVFVFDLTDRQSFENLPIWLSILDHLDSSLSAFYTHPSDIPRILVGNKCDLLNERVVQGSEAALFAAKHHMSYVETSTVNDTNIEMVYVTLSATVIRKHMDNVLKAQPDTAGCANTDRTHKDSQNK